MKNNYAYNHKPIKFDFQQSIERFFVEEIPLYKPTGKGNFLILKIKKQDMSSWKLVTVIAKATGLAERDIGYAGLKDKSATTIQYISIPKNVEKFLNKNLTTDKVKILERYYNKSPIKIGELKGNRFVIKLHKVSKSEAQNITNISTKLARLGFPNYFGYQRFGEDSLSYEQGKEIAESGKRLKGVKEKLLVASYQSHLFNSWLSSRVNLSTIITHNSINNASKILSYPKELVKVLSKQPQFFKLFIGDVVTPYPYGKSRFVRDMSSSATLFKEAKIAPTGLLCGENAIRAKSDAYHLEEPFDDRELYALKGDRRLAWIWAEDLSTSYDEKSKEFIIGFYLPKGSYATTFLEEIAKQKLVS
ncbi:tRNA pseudouridine 13 synthase [hydrothermal vent metagenome]|uniref:tRNA pseudouridine 13 synthase n=1 Tax=hydrothermal vent metagenome TaxID=652676 RepID=A0A1W1EH38_9ZZZZ